MQDRNDSIEVNISTDDALAVEGFPPYRILLISDFAGDERAVIQGPMEQGVVEVSPTTFGSTIAEARPSLSLTIKDPLTSSGAMTAVDIGITSIRDFDPKVLVQTTNVTQSLFAARERLDKALRGGSAPEALEKDIASILEGHSAQAVVMEHLRSKPDRVIDSAPPGEIDDLLTQLDLGPDAQAGHAGPPVSNAADLTARAAGNNRNVNNLAFGIRRATEEIDKCIGKWLMTILAAEPFRRCESAWRSVDHLLRHLDFRRGIKLQLLHSSFDDVVARFQACVIDPAFDHGVAAPDLVVLDARVQNTAPHMETLDALSANAASLPAVLICNLDPQFLGNSFAWQMSTLPPIRNIVDQWQFAKWNSLKARFHAHCLGVFAGRIMLRGPHESGTDSDSTALRFKERAIGENDFLWASAPLAAVRAVAAAVAETGWPVALTGGDYDRIDRCVVALGGKTGDKPIGPTDVQVPLARLEEFASAGINVVSSIQDSSEVWIGGAVCALVGAKSTGGISPDRTLTHQLVASRLANLLLNIKDSNPNLGRDELVDLIRRSATTWIPAAWQDVEAGESLSVSTSVSGDTSGLTVSLRLPPGLMPGDQPVTMAL